MTLNDEPTIPNLDGLSADDKLDMVAGGVESLRADMYKLNTMLAQFIGMVEQLGSHPMFAAFKQVKKT